MIWRRATATLLLVLTLALALLLAAWLARAQIAARFAREYFRQHGVSAAVEVGDLGLSGASGRFALGPAGAPDLSAARIELHFDPLSLVPRVVEVRLVDPVIRAHIDASGRVRLASLQAWLDSLGRQQGHSRFVSDDLAVSLQGLRALLGIPGGDLEVDGDVRLVRSLPVTAALRVLPATIVYQGQTLQVAAARLDFDNIKHRLDMQFSGSLQNAGLKARAIVARLDASGISWRQTQNRISVAAAAAHLKMQAASLTAGIALDAPALDATAGNLALSLSNGAVLGQADIDATADAGFALSGLRTPDPALTRRIAQNLSRLHLALRAHVARQADATSFALSAPMTIAGAKGGELRFGALQMSGTPAHLTGNLAAALRGPGLPSVQFALRNIAADSGIVAGDAALSARFDMAMLHGADASASGKLLWQGRRFTFAPSTCLRGTLAALNPGGSDLVRDLHADICAVKGQPLLSLDDQGWVFAGAAQNMAAVLPPANAQISKAAADLLFRGEGGEMSGHAGITALTVADRATPLRFQRLQANGTADLLKGVWHGQLAVAGGEKAYRLGDVSFTHTMASGVGAAHIAAPAIAFAQDKLQPEQLSPLLAALRRANGTVGFDGDISWTPAGLKSQGRLAINTLDFLTPLGRAHAVKSDIALTSLLPPATADNQQVTIARIDWTLPLSAVEVHFGFDPAAARIAAFNTGIAQGHAALGPLTINLADPAHLQGAVQLSAIALDALVAATNFGDKLKLQGKISGQVPFALTADGFRIVDGHVASDGPGRLSIDRSLWAQAGASASSNAMQDFAYQALENLSFDQMTADLNSVANGRLQVIFHIKGSNDPPKPQTADVPILDLLNGTALQKSIPLPSGTPIDLTLDTSLNFDELLKSYAAAWSNSLSPAGHPDTKVGGTP